MDNYNDAELRVRIDEIHATTQRIEKQTILTNGRVRSLEVWRGFITGGVAVISLVVTYLLTQI